MNEKPTPTEDSARYWQLVAEQTEIVAQSERLLKRGGEIHLECELIKSRSFDGKLPPKPAPVATEEAKS